MSAEGNGEYLARLRSVQVSRRTLLKTAAVASVAVAAGTPLAACGPAQQAGGALSELVVGYGVGITAVDPQVHGGAVDESILRNVYDALVTVSKDMTKVEPQLATEWKRIDDLTFQFKLRQGVTFHNGEPFDAEAAKFSIMRPLRPEVKAKQRAAYMIIKDAEVVDKYTINVKTATPDPVMPRRMSGQHMTIVPPGKYKELGGTDDAYNKWIATNGAGTGPYKLASWAARSEIVLEANDKYWGKAPDIKKVKIQYIPDHAVRAAALRAGDIQVCHALLPEEMDNIKKSGKAYVKEVTSNRVVAYWFEVRKPPVDNVKLRQAINYAANVESIIKTVMSGLGTRVATMLAPWHVGYDKDLKPYPYDPNKAKQLMAEAGFKDGFDVNIWLAEGRYIKDKEVAQAIAQELAKVGIRAKVNLTEAGLLSEMNAAMKLDGMQLGSWGNWMYDADNTLYSIYHSSARDSFKANNRPYGNPALDPVLDQARSTLDEKKRLELYKQAQKIIFEDAASLFMYQLHDIYGIDNRVVWEPRSDEMIWYNEMSWKK